MGGHEKLCFYLNLQIQQFYILKPLKIIQIKQSEKKNHSLFEVFIAHAMSLLMKGHELDIASLKRGQKQKS